MKQLSSDQGESVFVLVGVLIAFLGVLVFLYQSYLFLRHGELFLFSIIDSMEIINRFTYFAGQWVADPKDWIGLHLIMSWMPLAPVLFFSGAFFANVDWTS